jgi:hypothetical protein
MLCSVEGCERVASCRGLCSKHYNRFLRHGDPNVVRRRGVCTIEGCGKKASSRIHCRKHHYAFKNHGDPLHVRKRGKCWVADCDRLSESDQLCGMHYQRVKLRGTTHPVRLKAVPGSGHVNKWGYRLVYRPDSPMANKKSGTVLEHRLVMAEMIGRPLEKNENVHHKNGNRLDNSPENLELWVRGQPCGQRVEDLLAWAHQLIERYGGIRHTG